MDFASASGRIARLLGSARGALADLIAPLSCPICEAETTGSPLCRDCRAELLGAAGPACPRCARTVGPWAVVDGGCSACRGRPLGFDAAIAMGPYQGPIRDLTLRLKHRDDAWLAPWLAGVMVEARRDAIALEVERARDPGPVVVPVPLHWRRRIERGYNQAEALADAVARDLALRVARPIRRVRSTEKLAGSGRVARLATLKGAFAPRRGRADLGGRTVLLVDDVLTTGATCGAAARALKAAGAGRVVALVLARAELR